MKFDTAQLKDRLFGKVKDHTKIDMNPKRGWRLLAVTFFIINMAVIAFGVYYILYHDSASEASDLSSMTGGVQTIDRGALQRVLEEYGEKEKVMERLRAEQIQAVDPAE